MYIDNDIFSAVTVAAKGLYPELDALIHWDPTLSGDDLKDKFSRAITFKKPEFGYTFFPDDGGTPVVGVSPHIKVTAAAEVLAHELAHVVAGKEAGHGREWSDAFDAIHKRANEIMARCWEDGS
ncbi:ImmA/IrrE family metallo-endopeptidase [Paenibacillus lutimineralis]|uniref:ImmA/IrrE family metallo-endopeptidase n=1 Tax=Paenibacillus lutimineralis TaxID=2707005 RepID=A0A3S9V1P1_9BACL|nr:ImmA/IrrE family metallo-endopeptidase [Paenibacillus lutimineralis]AZS16463.1 hypothetical protein EI981_19750 [Paenibacillus lutimineralis]